MNASQESRELAVEAAALTRRFGALTAVDRIDLQVRGGEIFGLLGANGAGKSVIASRLNMTPEHFSRILHELAESGLIEVSGRTVRVLDLERLRGSGADSAKVG